VEQLIYYVSNPWILWLYIILILSFFGVYIAYNSRRFFIARELIYGVCNPRPGYVEEVIAHELAHVRLQEGEIEKYKIRLSTLTEEEVIHKQQLHNSVRYALRRVQQLKSYARYFNIAISDDRIDALAMKKLRDRASSL
jgi:hypothetical protein